MLSIEASDVIRLIQQFFQEQGLEKSLKALQEETEVATRTLDDTEAFLRDVIDGKWFEVLRRLSAVQLEPSLLTNLYEHIFLELAETGDVDAARMILRQSEPLDLLRKEDQNRYIKLENCLSTALLTKASGAKVDLIQKKEAKRARIGQELVKHLSGVPKGRLLTLLGEALQFEEQKHAFALISSGAHVEFDIFRGIVPVKVATTDAVPSTCYREVTMPHGQNVESAAFSPDGTYFVVGLADGFIEVWSPTAGKPRTDLPYQMHKADYMVMETSILSMAFSSDSQYLAVGTLNGDVAVWKIVNGTCVKKIPKAHIGGACSVQFSPDGTTLLTSGFDNAVRLFNLRSGAMQREFVGHQDFVHRALFSFEGHRVMSASGDGTLRIWQAKTGECIETITFSSEEKLSTEPVRDLVAIPKHLDAFLVCPQASASQVFGANGSKGKTLGFSTKSTAFSHALFSFSGKIAYLFGEDKSAHCFDYASGEFIKSFKVIDSADLIGAVHHPQLNIMIIFDTGNKVKFWRP